MQKSTAAKFSLVGLALVCASAVAAAFVPSDNKSEKKFAKAGELTDAVTSAGDLTCITQVGSVRECTNTQSTNEQSSLTSDEGGTSAENVNVGANTNTTVI